MCARDASLFSVASELEALCVCDGHTRDGSVDLSTSRLYASRGWDEEWLDWSIGRDTVEMDLEQYVHG